MRTDKLLYLLSSALSLRCCLMHLIKQNHSYHNNSGIPFPDFHSRTNLKLRNISVNPNFDSPNVFCSDCIPSIVLKNCEPELTYILAELFNICLKESCFPDCWKTSSVVAVFKNVGERSTD